MKKKVLSWILGILAAVLLLGSYYVKDIMGFSDAADIVRIFGFISLVFFTVFTFREDKS